MYTKINTPMGITFFLKNGYRIAYRDKWNDKPITRVSPLPCYDDPIGPHRAYKYWKKHFSDRNADALPARLRSSLMKDDWAKLEDWA